MSIELDWTRLDAIFQPRQDILDGIKRCAETPGKVALFNEIAAHLHDKLQGSGEPDQKRRKVQAASTNGAATPAVGNAAHEQVLLEIREISVSVPQRKKFELCFTENFLYARAPGTKAPIDSMIYPWSQIEYAFYLPVPEKTQVQHNYLLFPHGASIPPRGSPPTTEPLVFTVPATAPKEGTVGGSEAGAAAAVSDTYKTLFNWAFETRLRAVGNPVDIVSANPSKFHSVIRQSHRPNEKAVHIGAFRGSKDGYLFFLENGILWGYKKPLIFVPLKRIAAISYTNILQITFNIVIEVFPEEGDATEELEFGMIDQQDYGGIDDYIKRNGLQDRSMAEERKGKLQLAENKAKRGGDGENGVSGGDGLSELVKAQQDAGPDLDDEDEDEEDYDPGSDASSDGSGVSSDEDDDDDDDDEDDGDEDGEEDEDEEGEEGEEGDEQGLSLR